MNILDRAYISAKIKAEKFKESAHEFFTSERGVSNIVATILILLIVVILVGIFFDKLAAFVTKLFAEIFKDENIPDKGKIK